MEVSLKFLLHFFSLDFKRYNFKKVTASCGQDLMNAEIKLSKTYLDNAELVLFEDRTKIHDNAYLLALDQGENLLIYQRSDSKYFDLYLLVK